MKLASIIIAGSLIATPALAGSKTVAAAPPILQYMTVGAIVVGIAGALLCAGHPICIIAGAKLTTLAGAGVGAGVGAASGGVAAAVVR